jgi:BirA family biotin operon repressor/biotin-[acetyl-CoA-carboxylase] ligase
MAMDGHRVWSAEAIWESVVPLLPGFTVEIVPQIDSTNSELMRRARAGQLDPVLLVAERQTAGRGRLGRDWQSETAPQSQQSAASLTFSLGLPLQPHDWSGLSLAVGLAVVQSLHPDLRLKWPNDIWLEQRKLAGILIETTSVGQQRYVVIGIGINILPRSDDGLRTASAALTEVLPQADAPSTLQTLMLPLVQMLKQFAQDGFDPLRKAFHVRDLLYGQEVVCTGGMVGTARGVDAQGALLVHTAEGLKKISSAEVSVRPVPPAATATEHGV